MGCCEGGQRRGILCCYFLIGCLCSFLSFAGIAILVVAFNMHLDSLFLILCLFMIPISVLSLVLGIYYSFGAICYPDSLYTSGMEEEEALNREKTKQEEKLKREKEEKLKREKELLMQIV